MNFFKKIVAAGTSKLIDSMGSAIDKCVTSDDERLNIKKEMAAGVRAFELEMESSAVKYEGEITARLGIDMTSDSWLSKNIRPLLVAFLIGSTVLLAYTTIFGTLTTVQAEMVDPWITLLSTLDVTAITFYFGSRGMEKYQKIKGQNTPI